MAWDFSTDPAMQEQLDWVDEFVREECEPLDYVIPHPRDMRDPVRQELIPPLQDKVRAQGMWSAHLPPEYGGQGYGYVRLALIEELLGRSSSAPNVFGCQSPDSGNAQIIARYGTDEQREAYLEPLLQGRLVSCFSATEPQGGADPTLFTTHAELDGDEWVINGEKWFSSGLEYCAFAIVMAVTEPDNPPHSRMSMFLVPTTTPGINILRNVAVGIGEETGIHAHVRYEDVRVPRESLLGPRGRAFEVMQTRMGHARLALATRSLGQMRRALDLMAERAVSRHTKGEPLARKQLVQEHIAEAWLEYETFRLLVLRTAWKLDQLHEDYKAARGDISAVKIMLPRVMQSIGWHAAQIHGSLGVSHDMPFIHMVNAAVNFGVADGPTEVHKVTLAREALRDARPAPGMFPTFHLPERQAQAAQKYRAVLERYDRVPG
ncbi:MAG: acyl-CoA dehydrogenase family protein [Acidimicrobiales bacterium]|nr:acyl-CoA dehydrogenase family protein [Acidimicrobiales bacterium]